MVRVDEICCGRAEWVEDYASTQNAIDDLQMLWMEDPDRKCCWVITAFSGVVAVVVRHADDPEICVVAWAEGRVDYARCRYVVDGAGEYLHTEVEELTSVTQLTGRSIPALFGGPAAQPPF